MKNILLKDSYGQETQFSGVNSIVIPQNGGGGTITFVDTTDANAIASDLAQGKTAYVNGVKLIGEGSLTTASIVVSPETGATITNCTATTPRGIILQGVQVGNTWVFSGLSVFGTYAVTATDGTHTKTQNVLVDEIGQFNVTVVFKLYLYNEGDECTSITGGWIIEKAISNKSAAFGQKMQSSLYLYATQNFSGSGYRTYNKINITNYSMLCINVIGYTKDVSGQSYLQATENTDSVDNQYTVNNVTLGEHKYDISSYSGDVYIKESIYGWGTGGLNLNFNVNRIWLE